MMFTNSRELDITILFKDLAALYSTLEEINTKSPVRILYAEVSCYCTILSNKLHKLALCL